MMTPEAWNVLKATMKEGRFDHKRTDEIGAEVMTIAFRINDLSLRVELMFLAMSVTGDAPDFDEIEARLARFHRGLEMYATTIDAIA